MHDINFIQNIPFACIILSMFSGIISSILDGKKARRLTIGVITFVFITSAILLTYLIKTNESFVFWMGHFSAPWGNEIRAGVLEALMATFFSLIMFLCIVGGMDHIIEDVEESKMNLYFIMIDLLLSSLLALIYTNDLFTAYVFIEINTISACGLIMIRNVGRTTLAATKYMIMSLLGSGLFLIGISMLYDLTGHLLMSDIKESVHSIFEQGQYTVPLLVIIGLISVGLAIKSALYPFHSWLPSAYGYSTAASSAILSSLVSKGYIFLLIKIFYRVIGIEYITSSKVLNVLFTFGIIGMIMGSVNAIKQTDVRRMIAYSSVAQIGYIYMGMGLGTEAGMIAAIFHILTHSATKSMLFISATGLADASGKSQEYIDFKGAGYRDKVSGFAFAIASLSMVGMPTLAGFVSKLLFSTASLSTAHKMLPTLIALAISTILNAVYFLRFVLRTYTVAQDKREVSTGGRYRYKFVVLCFVILNFALGMCSDYVVQIIRSGLAMFA